MSEENSQSAPDNVVAKLCEFFANNPDAGHREDENAATITQPWGDESLEFVLRENVDTLVSALNAVYLPPALTAMWHRDTRELEIIYTPLSKTSDLFSRAFEFGFRNRVYRCEFSRSSDRLLLLASSMRTKEGQYPVTNHRNLQEFAIYQRRVARDPAFAERVVPTSFWVKGAEWDDDTVTELARNMNFYMRYFDRRCPTILIHVEDPPESRSPTRYPFEKFPPKIIARELDPYLLSLWEAIVRASDPFRAYIYSYQILEYSAFYYLSENVSQVVKRILAAPEFTIQPELGTRQILDTLVDFKATDEEKIAAVVKQVSDPATLWREIQTNIDAFSTENSFEGGFCLPALVKRDWTLEDFRISCYPNVAHSLRRLRNALVHGRESRTAKVVLPTRANYARVQPWKHLLYVIASQTILYES